MEAADPFLSKLQQQTEASYLELLSRKDQVPQTEEDDHEAEEREEVNIGRWHFCYSRLMQTGSLARFGISKLNINSH